MTVELLRDQQTASSSDEDSVENSSSSEEEETDSESESEPSVGSKKVETSLKPNTTANSSSSNPPLVDSNKIETSKKSLEDASSSEEEEEETDSESETEPNADSKIVSTSSKPKATTNSLSEVETDSPVVKLRPTEPSLSEDDEETDSEPETEPEVEPKTTTISLSEVETDTPVVKLIQERPTESSSSEDEEETDSEPEPETEPVADSLKVPETMGVETDFPVTNPVLKPLADSSSKAEASSKKRPSETDESRGKRAKRVDGDDGIDDAEATKKNYFQRVWTKGDEIVLLQGLVDYKNENGSDDKKALYELLKDSISFKVTKTQFLEKIRSLKRKFDNNLGKEKKKGEALVFSNPHDLEAFRLSKFVWGDNEIVAVAAKRIEPALVEPTQEFVSIMDSITRFGIDDLVAKKGWNRLSSEDKKSFEEEWHLEELKFNSGKSRIVRNVLRKMAEAS
ncbi:unnamed protein product [Eruca vesicaria subsp. sativa]|uniref:Storekeeper-like protein n=1 Tax=Eruca vesicaria subsp. sativa TaxID=29727 RepID=A0ABC8IRA4_ERUVS|nr:unnamed protein product [Eruca vesicaria subsp. sativa]